MLKFMLSSTFLVSFSAQSAFAAVGPPDDLAVQAFKPEPQLRLRRSTGPKHRLQG
ncbi:hypothetical protein EV130_110276 [Rhizobium azibense]|uniref:Uncharacterized protein n=1 Tax=Rhizobium azibense TaxID=1136135 RepID=A0A4R3QJV6_9HYPH|nr:hypothetical protein EV130_110276 [Rhizobium azibense]